MRFGGEFYTCESSQDSLGVIEKKVNKNCELQMFWKQFQPKKHTDWAAIGCLS